MPRKRSTLIKELIHLPWYIILIGGVILSALIQHLRQINYSHPFINNIFSHFDTLAYVVFMITLGLSFISLIKKIKRAHLIKKAQAIKNLRDFSWRDFESLAAGYFESKNYKILENTVSGSDGGVDIWLTKNGKRYIAQCKHFKKNKVGISTVRELLGTITYENVQGGFIVTSSILTTPAFEFARNNNIGVVNGNDLLSNNSLPDIPDEKPKRYSQDSPPQCHECGSPMRLRKAEKGYYAGQKFWGCVNYPSCKGIVNIN
jgi:restriction system protein